MAQDFNTSVAKDLFAIADELLDSSIKDPISKGIYWEGAPNFNNRENIYYGSSGIIQFLLNVYTFSGNAKYILGAELAAKWVVQYCLKNKSTNNTFYTGRLGAIYTLFCLFQHNQKQEFREAAITILEKTDAIPNNSTDLINGTAGELLGWLSVYKFYKSRKILYLIRVCTLTIIRQVKYGPNDGIIFSSNNLQNEYFHGFAHGNSGICKVLNLLSVVDNLNLLQRVAEVGVLLEDLDYSVDEQNWPAFDKGIFDQQTFNNYYEHTNETPRRHFTESYSDINWCSGLTGMLLSRLQFYGKYKHEIENGFFKLLDILNKSDNSHPLDLSLCHGMAGNALCLMELAHNCKFVDVKNLSRSLHSKIKFQFEKFGLQATGIKNANSRIDTSLFLGKTGIGYFYCYLLRPDISWNLLNPNVEKFCFPTRILRAEHILRELLLKTYPKALNSLTKKKANMILRTKISFSTNLQSDLLNLIQPFIKTFKSVAALEYDMKVLEFGRIREAKPFKFVKKEIVKSLNLKYKKTLIDREIKLSDNAMLMKEKWDWTSSTFKKSTTYILVFNNLNSITESKISNLSFRICKHFNTPKLISSLEIEDARILPQIHLFLDNGILTFI